MVFLRGFLGVTSRDLKILSNYSFYIDIYPIFANFCENGYYGCNLQFLVAHEIFWWNSDLFRALNFVNRSSGSKVMHKWLRVIFIYLWHDIYTFDFEFGPLKGYFWPPVISCKIENRLYLLGTLTPLVWYLTWLICIPFYIWTLIGPFVT